MIIQYCPLCGAFMAEGITGPASWDTKAIYEWQQEIARTCQHEPKCAGPWAHAVRAIRESHDHAKAQHDAYRRGAGPAQRIGTEGHR